MRSLPPEAGRQTTLRRSLRKRICTLLAAGGVLLTLLAVSAAVGIILAAANDAAGVAAMRAVAGILALATGLVLFAIVGTLSQAVVIILQEENLPESRHDSSLEKQITREPSETDGCSE